VSGAIDRIAPLRTRLAGDGERATRLLAERGARPTDPYWVRRGRASAA
jgi:hypothetical protein